MTELFAEVAVFNALDKTLHYQVPSGLRQQARIGARVLVPLGRRTAMGLIVKLDTASPDLAEEVVLRPLTAILDQTPVVPEDLLALSTWISKYYFYPLGEVLQLAVPAKARAVPEAYYRLAAGARKTCTRPGDSPLIELLSQKAELSVKELHRKLEGGKELRRELQKLERDGIIERIFRLDTVGPASRKTKHAPLDLGSDPASPPPTPSADQQNVLDAIRQHLQGPSFVTFLVFGVTGSGKSEIYLRLAETALEHQKGVLILAPEIALTFQLEALFRQRFGSELAIWHSGLSNRVRTAQWQDILSGKRKVVLGARSAIFMPVHQLGLIVIDEEHDSSYKQDDHLRYQARDVALMRAQMLKIPIVLGSATPSLQSFHHSRTNRYTLLSLPRRIHDRPLPDLEIIDMRRENRRSRVLSKALKAALTETLAAGQQALLFLNRRGFANFVLCHVCGHVLECESCSVSLTYHNKKESLCCHYCGAEKKLPAHCPACDHAALILHGFGTERIEKEVKKLLPEAQVLRIDRDTASEPRYMAECLESIRAHRANVLIGTQMLTKGHDFPSITLVGVVNADTSLQIADFRAGETTVQLLMQVAGRAGRGDMPGRVILQTYNPSHYTIESVLNMDYLGFCEKELESRERLQYPPFARLLRLLVTSTREELTREAAHELAGLCRTVALEFRSQAKYLAVLGPSPAPLVKLKNRFRWHIYIKAWTNQDLQQFTEVVLERSRANPVLRRVQLAIDRDPTMVM